MSQQGWTATRLPSGELRIDLHRRRIWMVFELGFISIFLALGILGLVFFKGFQGQLWSVLMVAFSAAFAVKSLTRPRAPRAWVLAPGRATLEWRERETETFAPTRVVIETFRQKPSQGSYIIPTSYNVFLQTEQGKIPVHEGFPLRDRHELARTVAEAVSVELVEVMVNSPSDSSSRF